MILYLSIICFSVVVLSVFNILFGLSLLQCEWWFVILACVIGVVFEFVVDGLFAIIINKTPNKWYTYDKNFFGVSKFERKFLEKCKVRRWKDKVWELGGLGGFSKKKIENPNSLEYIERFLIEINKGIVTHWIGIFAGFALVFCFPFRFALPICLPVALVNVFLNILPIMALRYNYPKLIVVHKKLKRDAENNEKTTQN